MEMWKNTDLEGPDFGQVSRISTQKQSLSRIVGRKNEENWQKLGRNKILWHVDTFLGKNRETIGKRLLVGNGP
jgi:hypothetical protein